MYFEGRQPSGGEVTILIYVTAVTLNRDRHRVVTRLLEILVLVTHIC